jgi:RNA polymerase sigma factor (sigma-70 family)
MLSFFRKKNYSDCSVNELLTLYREKDDQEALGILYEKHLEMVYGVCIKYLAEKELAQDAVLDIFEQLTEKAKHHDIVKFDGWLFMLAKNHCLMQLRKMQKNVVLSIEDRHLEAHEEEYIETDEKREENLQSLEACIEKLPQDQKQVVTMFYLEEKSYKEIADTMQIDTEKVRSFIQNGRRNLKNCMTGK